jgi:hypothetical protein
MSSMPPTNELVALGAPIVLRDGSRVRLRQGQSSDTQLLLRGFERLSSKSRYQRFLAAMPELSEASVRYLTDIDHHDHEAIAALDGETGEGIGVARYVRDPQRRDAAEVAVTVLDHWQKKASGHSCSRCSAPGRARKASETSLPWCSPLTMRCWMCSRLSDRC